MDSIIIRPTQAIAIPHDLKWHLTSYTPIKKYSNTALYKLSITILFSIGMSLYYFERISALQELFETVETFFYIFHARRV